MISIKLWHAIRRNFLIPVFCIFAFHAPSSVFAAEQPHYSTIHVSMPQITKRMQNWARVSSGQLQKALDAKDSVVVNWYREVLQEKKDAKSEVDLLELINWTVNRTVVYRSDWDHWHRRDYWEPLATTIKEGGDCEDFALAKAAALHIDGWPASQLRILIGYVTVRGQKVAHAVLLATTKSNREYVLDNRSKWVLSLNDFERGFQPLYSIDETGAHAEFFRTTPQPH